MTDQSEKIRHVRAAIARMHSLADQVNGPSTAESILSYMQTQVLANPHELGAPELYCVGMVDDPSETAAILYGTNKAHGRMWRENTLFVGSLFARCLTEKEMQVVIDHELGHAKAYRPYERLIYAYIADYNACTSHVGKALIEAEMDHTLARMAKTSKHKEFQADANIVDAASGISFFRKLRYIGGWKRELSHPFQGGHPSCTARIWRLQARAKKLAKAQQP